MLFVHLMERLIYGELSSFPFAAGGDTADIQEKDLKRMIAFTNDAIVDIASKIPTDIRTLTIDSKDNISQYHLTYDHALTNEDSEEEKYIRDSKEHPFTGEVLKVLEVRDECGRRIPLNNDAYCSSVFTPYYNVLMIPHAATGKSYEVAYVAKPVKIYHKQGRLEVGEQVIKIPVQLEEALQAKVASRFFVGMSGQEVSNKYMELTQRYETILENYKNNNMIDTTRASDTRRLRERGYV